MKAAWIHDHPFFIGNDNKVYSQSGVNHDALKRYLAYFDELVVTGRVRETKSTQGMACCSGENIEFCLNTEFTSIVQYYVQRGKLRNPIRKLINCVDCCFIMLPSLLGMIAIDECKKNNKPYIVQIIGCTWDTMWNYGTFGAKFLAPLLFFDMRSHVKQSGYVAYITDEFLQNRYPTLGKKGNGIANVILKSNNIDILTKRQKRIDEKTINEAILVGLIGSLDVSYKGHDIAIKAIADVAANYPNIELHFLGMGNAKRWEKFAQKFDVKSRVIFDGTLSSGDSVMEWFDNLDIYIQPSTSEGHGRSVVEAMSRACPTFASNVGGLADSLRHEYLFSPKEYLALSALIQKAISDKEFARGCAENNFEDSKKYDHKIIEEKRHQFFQMFIQDNNLR